MKTKKNMKVNPKLILKTAALVVIIAAFGTCDYLSGVINEPTVSFESVSLTGLGFSGADMKALIKVQNDNSITIPFPEINWKLFIADESFLDGVVKDGTTIAANGSALVELPFTVLYEGLYETITKLLSADETPYRIDLAVRFSLPALENKVFTASFDGSIPLPKLPELSFSGIKFNSISSFPPKVEFVLTWLIDNKNVFALNLDKLNYNFAVNGKSWASGAAPQNTPLLAHSSTEIPITVNINALPLITEIVAMAVTNSTADYTCGGEISLRPQGFDNFAVWDQLFDFSGIAVVKE